MKETVDQIQDLIVEKLGVKREQISAEKPMKDYGMDSLSQVELLFLIEDEFNVTIPDSEKNVETLADLAKVIDRLKANSSGKDPAQ